MPTKTRQAAISGLLDAIQKHEFDKVPASQIMSAEEIKEETVVRPVVQKEKKPNTNHQLLDEKIAYEVLELDTKDCGPWQYANRIGQFISDESCYDLIESIKKTGQQVPAIARITKNNKYEIICGARRLFVCQKLGLKLLAAIVTLSDKDALLVMDAENRPREDISPYERAVDYKRWVESGVYGSYAEIQKETGIKRSWFSKLIALADLDKSILAAFGHPKNLKQVWGYQLSLLCKNEKDKQQICGMAKAITNKGYKPKTVYQKLKSSIDSIQHIETEYYWVSNAMHEKLFKVQLNSTGKYSLYFDGDLNEEDMSSLVTDIKSSLKALTLKNRKDN